jgi:addiction module RelE/StbE family toxin
VTLRWSPRARDQVREIFEYIARDRPSAAEAILERFLERVDLPREFPLQGPAWGDGRQADLREVIVEGHRIVYRVGTDRISVLSVRHTRMEPDDLGDVPEVDLEE